MPTILFCMYKFQVSIYAEAGNDEEVSTRCYGVFYVKNHDLC
jgi:hypothetical protein